MLFKCVRCVLEVPVAFGSCGVSKVCLSLGMNWRMMLQIVISVAELQHINPIKIKKIKRLSITFI
jgi:hypothetical protein